MKKTVIQKNSGDSVSCFLEVPENAKGIVIAVHGMTSSKECSTYKTLFEMLPPAGYGVLGIDLPGHGYEESYEEKLTLTGAVDSIEAAEKFAVKNYPGLPVYYFASSFGAYLTMLYLSRRKHTGKKAFFRSAAVNMSTLFIKENPTEKEKTQMADLEEKGYFDAEMDSNKPVRIYRAFYDELAASDLFELFDKDLLVSHKIEMAHGEDDTVIDPEKAGAFAERFDIPVTFFKGEGHSLSNAADTPAKVVALAMELYSES